MRTSFIENGNTNENDPLNEWLIRALILISNSSTYTYLAVIFMVETTINLIDIPFQYEWKPRICDIFFLSEIISFSRRVVISNGVRKRGYF